MSFASLSASLKLNIQDFSTKLNEASRRMSSFASSLNQDYGRANAALKSHNLGLKDTARIVQGIVVSQTFYAAANAIADATRSLWDFNVALDYMQVTYSALFGSTRVASDFMAVLQEHSVETIFDYQNLADASKKLLAYGIEYENLMFIMEGLTNLGAMSGDSAALDRIALALGQIYTKGKLSAEEMRQLANAYIPITEILQDKFGLTGDDLKRVGDLNLPAADVINAIVDYANENFGSVGDAAMYTITGLQNKIVDSLKVVGAQMLKPVTTAYKSFLAYIASGLDVLRREFEAGGVGGVFEYLVPDQQTQQTIRQFIANVRNLFMALVSVGTVAGQVFGNFASVFVTAFNVVAPLITGFVNVLASLLNAMLQNRTGAMLLRVALVAAAGAFVVLKVQAAAALVITAVTKAVMALSKALLLLATIITRHPILALLAGLAITLVGVSTASSSANKSISGLFDTISGAGGGASSGDVLQKVEQGLNDSSSAADQFSNRLENATQAAENLGDAIGGAGGAADKAAKKTGGLLSFDEVFKLPDPADSKGGGGGGSGVGDGLLGDLENLAAGLGGLGDSLIPDIPDFSEFISGFTDGLFGGLEQGILDKLKAAGIGTLIGAGIGAIIGGIIGGPGGVILGAKIGAFAGGIAGLIVDGLDGAISNTIVSAGAGIAVAISKAFGGSFFAVLKQAFTNPGSLAGLFKNIGAMFTGTGMKSLLKGGVIGAAIGLFVDGLAHLLWNTLDNRFAGANVETAKIGQTIGSVIGAIIGGLIGGPAGAIIGSAIGTFAAGFVGLFWDPIMEYFNPSNNRLTAFFVQTGIDIAVWASNTITSLSDWFKKTLTGFSDWWDDTTGGFSSWWDDTTSGFSDWLSNTVAVFSDWDSITGDTLRTWFADTIDSYTSWFTETKSGFDTWKKETVHKIASWASESLLGVAKWVTDTYNKFAAWRTNILLILTGWAADALKAVTSWFADAISNIATWISNTYNRYNQWKKDVTAVLVGFGIAAVQALTAGVTNMATSLVNGLADIKKKWDAKWEEIKKNFGAWWANMKISMGTWLDMYIWTPIANFFNLNNFWNRIRKLLEDIKTKISNWWKDVAKIFNVDIDGKVNLSGSSSGGSSSGGSSSGASRAGHARGGVFNREHVARFAEKNKAEAIIPLEENTAMRPFVDAVSDGLVSSLAPLVAQSNMANSNGLPPMYVGTLIADERGLKQLYKKFEVIRLQENDRRGIPRT